MSRKERERGDRRDGERGHLKKESAEQETVGLRVPNHQVVIFKSEPPGLA